MSRLRRVWDELRRRHVVRVGITYVVVAVAVGGAADAFLPGLGAPAWALATVLAMLLLGLPLALALAWAFDVTPDGIERTPAPEDDPETGTAEPRSGRTSIAVLPFDDMSPDASDSYFADGLTDEIITHLAYVSSLRVISRSTSMVLKNTQKDVQTIGVDLNVQYVLEGSVRKAGESLRVTAQLIDAGADEHVWVERHDGTIGDVFAVQEQIAKRIVDALEIQLSPAEERRLVERSISDPKAYGTLVLALQEARTYSPDGIQRAIQLGKNVLRTTGANARVYASLGYFHYLAYDFGGAYHEDTLRQGEDYASKALELDPTLPLALLAKGLVRYKRGDMEGFTRHARPAAELGHDSDALFFLAFVLVGVGRVDEARAYAADAVATDPLVFQPYAVQALADTYEGKAEAGLERIRAARNRLAPGEPFAGWWLAQVAGYAGAVDEARAEYAAIAEMGAPLWSDLCELFRRALDGDRAGVVEHLAGSGLDDVARTDEVYPLFVANAMAQVGEHDRALDWLERSIDWGYTNYRFLGEQNRFLAPLRGNDRFRSLLMKAEDKCRSFDA